MTGQGFATKRLGAIAIEVEVRTVNNRFLKITSKLPDIAAPLEPQIESIVRDHVRRGSLNLSIRVSNLEKSSAQKIHIPTLQDYIEQSRSLGHDMGLNLTYDLGTLLQLPGVFETHTDEADEALLHEIQATIVNALTDLNRMRSAEGQAMASQLSTALDEIDSIRRQIEARSPGVVDEYRKRLETKLRNGLAELNHPISEVDVTREVLIFSDRCDIREETVRLASHLAQFRTSIQHAESQGRKLDFLIQELFRETNTIGSKANDAELSQLVVSVKTIIEQMRELIQNVE